jgi:hypothetical protein
MMSKTSPGSRFLLTERNSEISLYIQKISQNSVPHYFLNNLLESDLTDTAILLHLMHRYQRVLQSAIGWRKLRNENLRNFFSAPGIIRVTKSWMEWAGSECGSPVLIDTF